MGSKQKKGNSGELNVAKRGENRRKTADMKDSAGSREPTPETRSGSGSAAGSAAGSAGSGSAPVRSRPTSRQSSGVNPRKVSDGLQQLSPEAYRFVRESYLMLDSDGSGSVSKDTLRDMLATLGMRDSGDKRLNAMLDRTGEPITFAGYLAVMGELLSELPTRDEMDMMLEAFQKKDGSFDQAELRHAMLDEGLSADEVDAVIHRFSKPSRYGDMFDPKAFATTMSI